MTLEQFLYGGGDRAVFVLDVKAHKKFGDRGVRSTQVIYFDDEKIVGKVETTDGKIHRMTVKGWKSKK